MPFILNNTPQCVKDFIERFDSNYRVKALKFDLFLREVDGKDNLVLRKRLRPADYFIKKLAAEPRFEK
jgi:hypothetical protein